MLFRSLPIIAASVVSYKLTPLDNSNNSVGAGVIYNVRNNNCKYSNYRLHFLNKYGGFDSVNFNMISRETEMIERQKYKRVYGSNVSNVWSYAKSDAMETVFDVKGKQRIKINTDWLTQTQSIWLEELLTSPVIYHDIDLTTMEQISLNDMQYEVKRKPADKLIQLQIEFEYGYNKKRQRG